MPYNSKYWPQLADFGSLNGCINDLSARGFKSEIKTPAPAPPGPSAELIERQKDIERREAEAARKEEERKRRAAGAAAAEIAGKETKRLQGQFRSRARQKPGRAGTTGLRF